MKRRPRTERLVAEINITPFTDVILVLLVIFMIATPLLSVQSSAKVMPVKNQKSKSSTSKDTAKSSILINADGMLFLEKKAITLDELNDEIEALQSKNQELSIIVQADRVTQFRHVSKVLDVLSTQNVKNIKVTVENER